MAEIEKMESVQEKSQSIGSFIEEFLREKGVILAKYHKHTEECHVFGKKRYDTPQCGITNQQPIVFRYNIERLLAEYFNIDLDKVEGEKRKILEEIRNR